MPHKRNDSTREKGALWPIRDTAKLRELVEKAMEQHRAIYTERPEHFSEAGLARKCKLSASWLNLFRRKKISPKKIQFKTWWGLLTLMSLAGSECRNEFELICRSEGLRETLEYGYYQWLEESDRMASEGTGRRWERRGKRFRAIRITRDDSGLTQRDRERDRLWNYVRKEWPTLAKEFEDIFATDWSLHRNAALTRVLEPFLQCAESGYVMRSWREFYKDDRRVLIELGIKREKLMRPTSTPLGRMVAAADLPMADFLKLYGADKEAEISPFEIINRANYETTSE